MSAPPGAATRVFALLGDPVAHSRSPAIQNAAMGAAGLDALYVALRCHGDDLPGLLRGLANAGGGGNVTVPHKRLAAEAVEAPSEAVRATGACNTFWNEDGVVHGENTDVRGFLTAACHMIGDLEGKRVLLLGAGGAARAAAYALLQAYVSRVVIRNRTREHAEAIAEHLRDPRLTVAERSDGKVDEAFDLVVNATSLGLHDGDPLPLETTEMPAGAAAMDMVYAPAATPWVSALRDAGFQAEDGSAMLIAQAAAAFECWFHQKPDEGVMRRAIHEATTRAG